MKTLTKLLLILTLLILPTLLASCDTALLDQLTSGKSFMELLSQNGSLNVDSEKIQFDYVIETEEGTEKKLSLQLNVCGGKLALSEEISSDALPVVLTKAGYTFDGWYTEPDMSGKQVIDANGCLVNLLALAKCENHLCDGNGCIELYAGFIPNENESTESSDLAVTPEDEIIEDSTEESVEESIEESIEESTDASAENSIEETTEDSEIIS